MGTFNQAAETSDKTLLDHLRRHGSASVAELVRVTGVTATAVRQRLTRLAAEGLVSRESVNVGRGRPAFRYLLSEKGVRSAGTNYSELALTLWDEIRAIESPEIQRGLLARIAKRLSANYEGVVTGDTQKERLKSLANVLEDRGIPCDYDDSGGLPVLSALACPYPELAEQDRGICSMERMFLAEIVGGNVSLAECRLDGSNCCTFEGNADE